MVLVRGASAGHVVGPPGDEGVCGLEAVGGFQAGADGREYAICF